MANTDLILLVQILLVIAKTIFFTFGLIYSLVFVRTLAQYILYIIKNVTIRWGIDLILKPSIYWGIFYLLVKLGPIILSNL